MDNNAGWQFGFDENPNKHHVPNDNSSILKSVEWRVHSREI
jgi:hypothetical protein